MDLENDPGNNTTLNSPRDDCRTHVHYPNGHRKDAGITFVSREVNTEASDFEYSGTNSPDENRKTHSCNSGYIGYPTGNNVEAIDLTTIDGRAAKGIAKYLTSPGGATAEEGVAAEDVAATGDIATKRGVKAIYRTAVEGAIAGRDVATGEKLVEDAIGDAVITVLGAITGDRVATGLKVTAHNDAEEG